MLEFFTGYDICYLSRTSEILEKFAGTAKTRGGNKMTRKDSHRLTQPNFPLRLELPRLAKKK